MRGRAAERQAGEQKEFVLRNTLSLFCEFKRKVTVLLFDGRMLMMLVMIHYGFFFQDIK